MESLPKSIRERIGLNLHRQEQHPICIIKQIIAEWFQTQIPGTIHVDNLDPIVSVVDNFDNLLMPADHPARSKSDTYYINDTTVLRTQTSAHQTQMLIQYPDLPGFLVTGDVYRRDEIDARHFPVFHQMEGVFQVPKDTDPIVWLQNLLINLAKYLFPYLQEKYEKIRINPDRFPFTEPSFEMEIETEHPPYCWLEILGCGIVHPKILTNVGLPTCYRVAFGLGLERLAMLLFKIPDIRYFWSTSPRFLDQFGQDWRKIQFRPFSNLPSQYNDISFWYDNPMGTSDVWTEEQDFFDIVREIGGDWVESVVLQDQFRHSKTGQVSRMYRITYSPMDPNIKDSADFTNLCNTLQNQIRDIVAIKLNIKLR